MKLTLFINKGLFPIAFQERKIIKRSIYVAL